MQINKNQRNAYINDIQYALKHIYDIRYMVYAIWYMDMVNICIYLFIYALATPPFLSPSFASDLFLFSFRILFYLFLTLWLFLSLSVCGSCGFQQKSIIYVMAKQCRDPQTEDWGETGETVVVALFVVCHIEHRTVCCHSSPSSVCLFPLYSGYFSFRFCISAVNCTS